MLIDTGPLPGQDPARHLRLTHARGDLLIGLPSGGRGANPAPVTRAVRLPAGRVPAGEAMLDPLFARPLAQGPGACGRSRHIAGVRRVKAGTGPQPPVEDMDVAQTGRYGDSGRDGAPSSNQGNHRSPAQPSGFRSKRRDFAAQNSRRRHGRVKHGTRHRPPHLFQRRPPRAQRSRAPWRLRRLPACIRAAAVTVGARPPRIPHRIALVGLRRPLLRRASSKEGRPSTRSGDEVVVS